MPEEELFLLFLEFCIYLAQLFWDLSILYFQLYHLILANFGDIAFLAICASMVLFGISDQTGKK